MRRTAVAAAMLGCLLAARGTDAAIALRVELTEDVTQTVALRLVIRNEGDEPAHDIVPALSFGAIQSNLTVHSNLPPGFRQEWNATLPLPGAPGVHPVVLHVRYRDADGRPASAPLVHLVRTGPAATDPPAVELEVPTVDRPTLGSLRIQASGGPTRNVDVEMIAPDELGIDPSTLSATVTPGAAIERAFTVSNRGALPGNRQPLYALVRWVDGERPMARIASTIVAIAEPEIPLLSTEGWLVLAGAGLLLAGLLMILQRARAGASPTSRAERRRQRHR